MLIFIFIDDAGDYAKIGKLYEVISPDSLRFGLQAFIAHILLLSM